VKAIPSVRVSVGHDVGLAVGLFEVDRVFRHRLERIVVRDDAELLERVEPFELPDEIVLLFSLSRLAVGSSRKAISSGLTRSMIANRTASAAAIFSPPERFPNGLC